ncbi:oxidoreductase [Lentzea sp. NBRC 105346]|uniref:protoporphyrinogen/coproporphyrinogen oxidase n=1 Tax=Lentzea sp. NBRC 105346 TaxID=3032205 RepID=UPI0024A37D99|nr:NAD(P)/FAD-dependent oxidoreductase [Lentzea sp. NBRC 105346]GLZ31844.1 oxidoreductase [Lentzea sp. NBRC 105346]
MTDVDVAVIGAGIAGLVTAYTLREAGADVQVFEAADHVGGRMTTLRRDGFLIDSGAEQIPTRGYPETWRLIDELGVTGVPRIGRPVAMWRNGKARNGVAHPMGLLTGAGLAPRARLDLMRAVRRRPVSGTVAEFAAPWHRDVLDYLCQPVVSGFFGWDPARSAAAPFVELLTSFGSSSGWRTYRDGMDTLCRALESTVDVSLSCPVDEVTANGRVRIRAGRAEVTARSAVLAVPAPVACSLYADAPEFVRASTFRPMLKVHLMLDHRPASRAYLVAVPSVENPAVSVILFDHLKHPGRAPAGHGLVTLIANPAVVPPLLDAPDEEVVHRLLGAAAPFVPSLATGVRGHVVHRFRHGLPEATPKALALRAGFRPDLVDYAGDWVDPSPCSESAVRSGRRAAARVLRRKELG